MHKRPPRAPSVPAKLPALGYVIAIIIGPINISIFRNILILNDFASWLPVERRRICYRWHANIKHMPAVI
jgi:hypothetical protein